MVTEVQAGTHNLNALIQNGFVQPFHWTIEPDSKCNLCLVSKDSLDSNGKLISNLIKLLFSRSMVHV